MNPVLCRTLTEVFRYIGERAHFELLCHRCNKIYSASSLDEKILFQDRFFCRNCFGQEMMDRKNLSAPLLIPDEELKKVEPIDFDIRGLYRYEPRGT